MGGAARGGRRRRPDGVVPDARHHPRVRRGHARRVGRAGRGPDEVHRPLPGQGTLLHRAPDGRRPAERFRELRREHNNLRAALQYTLDDAPAERHRHGAELAIALSGYWAMSGLLREGRYWLAKVLDLFPGPSRVRGWALACRCYLGAMQGAADEAVADGTAGTEIGVALGDKMLVGRGYAS